MFYYPAILNRQTGCFSTIWLVATNGKKVSKREILKVNVPRTCNDLMEYILVRVPPLRPDLEQPRLSLYLSSLLQYGVIKVYHQQCNIQLKDIRDVVQRIEKFKVKQKIDMGIPGGAMSLPDALCLMENNEWADDPLFGQMIEADLASISPSALARMGGQFHAWSPQTSFHGSQDSITARPEDITMKEATSVVMPLPEFEGADFGEVDNDIVDFLIDLPDDAFGTAGPTSEREGEAGGVDITDPSIERGRGEGDMTGSPRTATTPAAPEAVLPPAASPRASPPHHELPAPEDRRAAPEGGDDEDVPTPPPQRGVKRKRRQPRLVVDRVTSISQEEFSEQISNVIAHTADPPMAGGVRDDPARLLTRPCNILPVEVMPLWDRVAVIPSYAERQSEQRQESSGYSSSEKAPSDDIPPPSDGDMSDHGREQPLPSEQMEGVPEGPEVAAGMDVDMEAEVEAGMDMEAEGHAEVDMDIGPEGEEEEPDRGAEFMRVFEEQDETSVTLRSMLGEGLPSRKAMASAFMTLLEQVTGDTLNAEQQEPFDDIWISLGPLLSQE